MNKTGFGFLRLPKTADDTLAAGHAKASACVACRQCEKNCPQGLQEEAKVFEKEKV